MHDEGGTDRMVDALVERGLVHDPRIEAAFRAVPRERFVPPARRLDAHLDAPLPIGAGQTVSAPHMVAIMLEALDVRPGHRVLEVGGGSGYHAALLATLARPGGRVLSVERIPELAARADAICRDLDLPVEFVVADGSAGWPRAAPYDRISVAAAAPSLPPPLVQQLAPAGVMVIPVGAPDLQHLVRVHHDRGTPRATGGDAPLEQGGPWDVRSEDLGPVRFVPLLGRYGFPAL